MNSSPSRPPRLHLFYLVIACLFAALSAYEISATEPLAGQLPVHMIDESAQVAD